MHANAKKSWDTLKKHYGHYREGRDANVAMPLAMEFKKQ